MPERPRLLLLHGALGAGDQFNRLVPMLEEWFDLHVIDFPGHGGAEFTGDSFSIQAFSTFLRGWLDARGIQGADIFGYSMGGYVALHLARHSPAHVGRVFTLATKFAWNPETAERETKMLDPEKIEAKVPRFAEQLSMRHGAQEWKQVLRRTAEMMTALGSQNELSMEDLGYVDQPVTISIGDRDQMVSVEESLAAYRHLPNGRFVVLPGTPHPLEKVSLGRLVREILDFFAGEEYQAIENKSTKSTN